ncbi:MAG: response regulator [Oscillospiraceae bacterium]|nr:response regulator [Oscillospiraceae bacterium]
MESNNTPARKKKILAVDDVSVFLKSLTMQLKNHPYDLMCTSSAKFALRYLQANRPDLFILDIEMPDINGFELAEKIRELGHTAPIIFLTGESHKDSIVKALQIGVADYILKPFHKEQLLEKIEKHI